MVPVFTGTIKNGRLNPDNPYRYIAHLAKYEGQHVEIVVRKPKSRRSMAQNAAYWGIAVEILANHLGYDKDMMHEALKYKFASRLDPDTGLMRYNNSRKMDTVRFAKYYEDIQRWASEFLNCYIPSPNECEFFSQVS